VGTRPSTPVGTSRLRQREIEAFLKTVTADLLSTVTQVTGNPNKSGVDQFIPVHEGGFRPIGPASLLLLRPELTKHLRLFPRSSEHRYF
jgi:hypothetical protein